MKTTVEIDDRLLRESRKRAIDEGRSFRAVLNDALREYVGAPSVRPHRERQSGNDTGDGSQSADSFRKDVAAAEFWMMVSDRSRWDELFGGSAPGSWARSVRVVDGGSESDQT